MIAALFPGQGSQTPDMRSVVERLRPDLLELCQEELRLDPFERVGEGTHMAQPAIYCASLAGWSLLENENVELMAGHSLGEFAALVAAGAMSERDGLKLVALRGRLMHRATGGGMMAVGAPLPTASDLAERFELTLANDNSPEQVVLSGDAAAIDAACGRAKVEGLRAARLRVSGAFHSPAMAAAAPELEEALDAVELNHPRVPVYSGVTAAPFDDDIRARLVEGLTSPVRWREIALALRDRGATRFLEVGPGRVLTGLVRKTLGADVNAEVVSQEAARA
ncbi:MAG TPA: ACP S-malonyltransferase [Thermoleophilaceae bacterium]